MFYEYLYLPDLESDLRNGEHRWYKESVKIRKSEQLSDFMIYLSLQIPKKIQSRDSKTQILVCIKIHTYLDTHFQTPRLFEKVFILKYEELELS